MAFGLSPSKMKDMVSKTVSTNMKLLEAQSRFAESVLKRNTAVIVEIADARISNLQELTSIKSFSELYDNTLALEGTVRDKVLGLYEDNTAASKEFGQEVKTLLEIDEMIAKVKTVSSEVSDKVKSVSESAIDKAKGLSESTIAKAKDLSETAVAKVKDVSGNFTSSARKTFAPAESSVKATARKPAAKKTPATAQKAPVEPTPENV